MGSGSTWEVTIQERDERRWRRVVQVLLSEADQVTSTRARAEKLLDVGQIWHLNLGDPDRAAPYYREAANLDIGVAKRTIDTLLERVQSHPATSVETVLLDILAAVGRTETLIAYLRSLGHAATTAEEAVDYFLRAAKAAIDGSDDPSISRQLLVSAHRRSHEGVGHRILDLAAQHQSAWPSDEVIAALRAMLLVEEGRGTDAVDALLKASVHNFEPSIKAKLRLRAAALLLDVVGRPMDAINTLRDALAIAPTVSEEVRGVLESIPENYRVTPSMVDELVDAFDTLGAHDRAQHMFRMAQEHADASEQADLYLRQGRHAELYCPDPDTRFQLFYEGAQSCMNDLLPFIEGMKRAVWDGAEGEIDTLLDLLEAEEDWSAYASLLDDYAQLLPEDIDKAACIFRAGETVETHLSDQSGALSRYLQAHRLAPEVASYSLAVERIYRQQERWDLLDDLLERRFERATTRRAQVDIRLMQADIRHGKLGEPVAAYDILRDALRLVESHRTEPVYNAMAELVRDMWAFPAIEEGLKARMESAEESQAAAKLAQELSFLHLEFLKDQETGLDLLRRAVDHCPEDPTIFERVTQQFEIHADDLTLARWLEAADTRPLDARLRADALSRALDIYKSLGAEWSVCRRVWDALLRLDAGDPERVSAAVQQADTAEDDGAVAQFLTYGLDGGAAAVASEFVRLRWMRRLADIHKSQGDLGAAARRHRTILQEWPLDNEAYDGLYRCLEEMQDWSALTETLRQRILLIEGAEKSIEINLRLELAMALETHHQDFDAAIETLAFLLDRTPLDVHVAERLKHLYELKEDAEGQVRVREALLSAVDPEERRRLVDEMLDLLDDVDERSPTIERILNHQIELDPTDRLPRTRLLVLYRERGEYEHLIHELDALWRLEPSRAHLALIRERAQLLSDRGEDIGSATEAWEDLLTHAPDDSDALIALQYLYRQQEREPAVLDILNRRLDVETDTAEKLAIFREIGVLTELKLGDLDAAFDAWKGALNLAPESTEALEELIRLAEDRGDLDGLVEYGRIWFDSRDEDDPDLLRKVAIACAKKEDSEVAFSMWSTLLESIPDDHEALTILAARAEKNGDRESAADFYGRIASSDAPKTDRQTALIRQATILEELERYDEALTVFHTIASIDGQSTETWIDVYRMAIRCERLSDAASALDAAIQRCQVGEERLNLSRRAAQLALEELGDQGRATQYLEQVLAYDSRDLDALSTLWPLYCEQGRHLDMFRTLDSLARAATNGQYAARYLADAASWVEEKNLDLSVAFECWWRAHRLAEGTHETALNRLRELAESTGRWSDYIDALELAASHSVEQEERADFLMTACVVARDELKDSPHAFELVSRALFEVPENADAVSVLIALAHSLDDPDYWLSLADSLAHVAQHTSDVQPELYVTAGEALERSNELHRAFDAYHYAFELSQGYVGAEALFQSALHTGRSDDLAAGITKAVEPLDRENRAERMAVFAALYEAWPEGEEKAFETYLQSMQIVHDDEHVRAQIWRLAAQLDAWPILIRFFDMLTDLAHDPQERFSFLCQRAELEYGRLNERELAFGTMKRAISLMPLDDRARALLEGWAMDQGRLMDVARFYEEEGGWVEQAGARIVLFRAAADLYRQLDATDDAARMVHQISELDPDDEQLVDERIELLERARDMAGLSKVLQLQSDRSRGDRRDFFLRKLARLHDDRLGDSSIAESAWLQLLEGHPGDSEPYEALSRAYRAQENWAALEEIMSRRATALEGAELYALSQERATLCATALGRRSQAFELLASVVEQSVEDGSILFEMENLVEQRSQAVELVRLAEQALIALVEEDHPPVLKMIGRVAQVHLGRPQTALNALTKALSYTPDDIQLAQELLHLQRGQKKHAECLATYKTYGPALLSGEGGDPPALQWYLDVAELQETNLLDFQGAVDTYESLLKEFPGEQRALMGLRNLLGRLRLLPRLAEVVSELAAMTEAPKDVMLLVEGARSITGMGELSVAIPLWSMVLERAPGHDEAQETVMRHARRENDVPMMRSVHRSQVRSAKGMIEVAQAWCAMASFERKSAQDDEAAILAYQEALEADPQNAIALMGLAELLLLHNRQESIPTLADIMIQRFDEGLEDVVRDDFAQLLGQLQMERANMVLAESENEKDSDRESLILEILEVGYARAPQLRDLAQMYADHLYAIGRLVDAGRIYDHTMFPSFIRGALGDELRAGEHLRRAHALQSIGLDVQAIHHFESAARYAQTRVEALAALAGIQEKAERWEAAARYREKLADVVEDPARAAASLFASGQLLEVHLGRFHRALKLYRRAIKAGLREPMMLLKILDVLEKGGHRADAAEVIDRLLEIDLSNRSKAKLLTRRARIMGSEEGWTAALMGLLDAIAMEPEDTERIDELMDLLDGQDNVPDELRERLDEILTEHHEHWPQAHIMRLSRWHAAEGHLSHAIDLVEGLQLGGEDAFDVLDGRSRLYAVRYEEERRDEDLRASIHNRLASLQALPGEPSALRHLHQVLRLGDREEDALLPLGLLNVLGQASAEEVDTIKTLSESVSPRAIELEHVRGQALKVAQVVEDLLSAVLGGVGEALDDAFRLARTEENEGWTPCDEKIAMEIESVRRVAQWPELEVGVIPGSDRGPEVLSFHPVRLLLPMAILDGMTSYRRRFFVARALYLAQGTGIYLSCLPPEESLAIMAGAIALLSPENGPEYALSMGADEDGIAYWAEFILENSTEEERAEWVSLADAVTQTSSEAFLEWADWVYASANRAALMISGDLAGAIRALKSESTDGRAQVVSGPVAFRQLLSDVPEIARLHGFAFQESFWMQGETQSTE